MKKLLILLLCILAFTTLFFTGCADTNTKDPEILTLSPEISVDQPIKTPIETTTETIVEDPEKELRENAEVMLDKITKSIEEMGSKEYNKVISRWGANSEYLDNYIKGLSSEDLMLIQSEDVSPKDYWLSSCLIQFVEEANFPETIAADLCYPKDSKWHKVAVEVHECRMKMNSNDKDIKNEGALAFGELHKKEYVGFVASNYPESTLGDNDKQRAYMTLIFGCGWTTYTSKGFKFKFDVSDMEFNFRDKITKPISFEEQDNILENAKLYPIVIDGEEVNVNYWQYLNHRFGGYIQSPNIGELDSPVLIK